MRSDPLHYTHLLRASCALSYRQKESNHDVFPQKKRYSYLRFLVNAKWLESDKEIQKVTLLY